MQHLWLICSAVLGVLTLWPQGMVQSRKDPPRGRERIQSQRGDRFRIYWRTDFCITGLKNTDRTTHTGDQGSNPSAASENTRVKCAWGPCLGQLPWNWPVESWPLYTCGLLSFLQWQAISCVSRAPECVFSCLLNCVLESHSLHCPCTPPIISRWPRFQGEHSEPYICPDHVPLHG